MERCVLVIAGLDPSGAAGLLADVATIRGAGLLPIGVATALTVQDSARCHEWEGADPDLVDRQLEALVEDLPIAAIKIGMLGSAAMVAVVAKAIAPLVGRGVKVVLDPVLAASLGGPLLEGDPGEVLAPLWSLATLLTPNRAEAESLTGLSLEGNGTTPDDRRRAARALRRLGPSAVLLKGGHFEGGAIYDLLDDGEAPLELASVRRPGATPRGTGCALATEIACQLAIGSSLREAVTRAHARTAVRIGAAVVVGRGRPFLGPSPPPEKQRAP